MPKYPMNDALWEKHKAGKEVSIRELLLSEREMDFPQDTLWDKAVCIVVMAMVGSFALLVLGLWASTIISWIGSQ